MSTLHCHVVVAAAGKGIRFQNEVPKQFHIIKGQAIISHTVEKFVRESCVKSIIVVAPNSDELMTKMEEMLNIQMTESNKIIITPGGKTRHRSIFEGLLCLKNMLSKQDPLSQDWKDEIVIIHDGVRPFVNSDDIARVVEAAKKYKAAGLVKPLVSTILRPDSDNFLQCSLDRASYWSSEMPQAFHLGTILQSYEKCSEHDFEYGTECLHIARKYGNISAKLLEGDPNRLWKITLQQDIQAAEALLSGCENMVLVLPNNIALRQNLSSYIGDILTSDDEVHQHVFKHKQIFCLLDKMEDLLSKMENVVNVFEHSSCKKSCHLVAFLFDSKPFTVDENMRLMFWNFCGHVSKFGIVSQLIIKEDLLHKGLQDFLSLAATFEKLPAGQVLYF